MVKIQVSHFMNKYLIIGLIAVLIIIAVTYFVKKNEELTLLRSISNLADCTLNEKLQQASESPRIQVSGFVLNSDI